VPSWWLVAFKQAVPQGFCCLAITDARHVFAAFGGYLGDDKAQWAQYDATEMLKKYKGPKLPVLLDQGLADGFYKVRVRCAPICVLPTYTRICLRLLCGAARPLTAACSESLSGLSKGKMRLCRTGS
jgi:S-formylglutathione hydrolase FrmB